MSPLEACQRCLDPVRTRRRGTGFCTDRCAKEQADADRASAEMEQDFLAQHPEQPQEPYAS